MERALNFAWRERVLVLLALGFVLFRVVGFVHTEPGFFADTVGYQNTAGEPILSIDFLAGQRAPTLPLLYKVVTGDEARIWAQLAISIVCWFALAAAVAASIRDRRLRPVAFAAILVFALAREIVQWDVALLSESVSLSLTAALTATWLWIARWPSWRAYGVMLALAVAWTLVRDPHAYVIAGLAVVLALSILVSRDWGGARDMRGAVAVALVAIAVASYASANSHYARWAYPLQNVVVIRIAPDADSLAYFEDHGMPATPELLAAMQQDRSGGAPPLLSTPPTSADEDQLRDATPFHRWLLTEGRSTYMTFLLTHPGFVAGAFDHLWQALLNPEYRLYLSNTSPWDGGLPAEALFANTRRRVIAWLVLALCMGAYVGVRFGPRREWAVPVFLIAASLPFAILVWHAGPLEPDRHALLPSVFLRLGWLLLVLFAADRWLEARSQAPRGSAQTVD